ncbi:phosphonate C-P lyase system protein PhnG [Billgrantia kenyensis]|uniref:Phosphonate C-P lyase system protein PhnG n=1 Tax=Billgrantia kenyensis TaxID=321266 RepID=A0A7V9W1I9_9GAMM|nr:phosphonate C-P lyase system protein PhnG [Halomonas kenyensis]MBA2779341.1 phosphonate C-P lyase system protein PhnG [Halomonas kenyensis]MCG6662511.1 phosphonate C-P lyase system protein PhnG [Halomonas kenyensis]
MTDSQRRQRILALTPWERLAEHWERLGIRPGYRCVRGPEVGMAMVRGRMGGTGRAFNLGEMTLTRASVQLTDEVVPDAPLGHGWVKGRHARHAELIALVDACAQRGDWAVAIDEGLVAPLDAALAVERDAHGRQAAATRVDFFTLVRGE